MNIEEVREYCLSKPFTTECFPFDEFTLVFKAGTTDHNKMFALSSLKRIPLWINLKCNPERALELREEFSAIIPGYHMNKKHWNTVSLEGDVDNKLLRELIDHSYDLIINSLPKKAQAIIKEL